MREGVFGVWLGSAEVGNPEVASNLKKHRTALVEH